MTIMYAIYRGLWSPIVSMIPTQIGIVAMSVYQLYEANSGFM